MQFDLSETQTDVISRAQGRTLRGDEPDPWAQVAGAGLAGLMVPTEFGGLGLGMVETALAVEELAAGGIGAALADVVLRQAVLGGRLIALHGSATLQTLVLPGLCSGDIRICLAMDAADPTQRAPHLGVYVENDALHGHVTTPGGLADATHLLVPARELAVIGPAGQDSTLYLVPIARAGIISEHGLRFDGVPVRDDDRLGDPGQGWRVLRRGLGLNQIVTTAALLGVGRAAMTLGKTGAEALADPSDPLQASLQAPLAWHWAGLEAARVLLHKAAWLADQQRPWLAEANAARLIAGESAVALAEHAIPLAGPEATRLWRDARATQFAAVSHTTVLRCIAGQTLDLPRPVAARR